MTGVEGEPKVPIARASTRLSPSNPIVLLVALVALLVALPFLDYTPGGEVVESGLLTVVMVAAAFAVGSHRNTAIWAAVLLTPALAGKWANHVRPDLAPPEFFLIASLLFVGFATLQLFRFIMLTPKVDTQVLSAGLAAYLMLGLLWAFMYILTARLVPGSFHLPDGPGPEMKGFTAVYFSFITLATIGYGDIVPISPPARMLAMMEGMTGVLYVAVLVARLVSLYRGYRAADGD